MARLVDKPKPSKLLLGDGVCLCPLKLFIKKKQGQIQIWKYQFSWTTFQSSTDPAQHRRPWVIRHWLEDTWQTMWRSQKFKCKTGIYIFYSISLKNSWSNCQHRSPCEWTTKQRKFLYSTQQRTVVWNILTVDSTGWNKCTIKACFYLNGFPQRQM